MLMGNKRYMLSTLEVIHASMANILGTFLLAIIQASNITRKNVLESDWRFLRMCTFSRSEVDENIEQHQTQTCWKQFRVVRCLS